jgi:hypothetical protein
VKYESTPYGLGNSQANGECLTISPVSDEISYQEQLSYFQFLKLLQE